MNGDRPPQVKVTIQAVDGHGKTFEPINIVVPCGDHDPQKIAEIISGQVEVTQGLLGLIYED